MLLMLKKYNHQHFQTTLAVSLLSACMMVNAMMEPNPKGLIDFLFSPCKCRCGVPNREARLLGGEFLRGYEFPWLSLIQINGIRTVPGTLINNKYVITGASNLIGLTPFDVKVTLGLFDRCFPDVSSTNVSVDKIILHPDFGAGNRAHDIALLKLSAPVNFERRISPVCLSFPGNRYLGQVATVVGWAETESIDGPITASCRPRKLGLPILDSTECLSTALDTQFVSADKGCVGVIGAPSVICKLKKTDVNCFQVDSGGPVMYRSHNGIYELIGVFSNTNECGNKPSTALYININDHLSWITENTRDACYCFKT